MIIDTIQARTLSASKAVARCNTKDVLDKQGMGEVLNITLSLQR